MNNQRSVPPPKKHNNYPVTDHKEMEISELPDKKFKIIILRKLSELQENIGRQLNKIGETTHEQNKKLNRKYKS